VGKLGPVTSRTDTGRGGADRTRPAVARTTTALAGLLVLVVLVAPNEVGALTPGAFVRVPLEALLGVALVLVLPAPGRRPVAAVLGAVLGLLTVLKLLDMGFLAALARPFDPVFDWRLFDDALGFLAGSIGRAAAIGAAVAAVVLAVAVLVVVTLAALRLGQVVARHRRTAARGLAVLTAVWVTCAVLGAQLVPGVPVAAGSTVALAHERALQVRASWQDREEFAGQLAVDAFRDTPPDELLTGVRDKDVVLAFVESYGRDAVADPEFAPQVGAVLADGDRRLGAAGFAARSAFLTAPTAGGASWQAHATFLSGLWIDNQQRYRTLVASDRFTLPGAFRSAGWRTVAVMPGTTEDWPAAGFYGYDQVYDVRNLGYRGPNLGWATVPDQYTLSAFERLERATPDRAPILAEIALVSSHAPWPLIPPIVDWGRVGDGSVFQAAAEGAEPRGAVWARGTAHIRTEYRRSIEYSLRSLISYVETYGDDDLVLVFLGDHQPAPIVTGEDAGRDVPITIVTRDRAVLDRIAGWNWQEGLNPGPQAPVWRMDAFRDRFLAAFSRTTIR
jgi:hypothetical protein